MVYIDMTKPDRELEPGVDLWEVAECVSKRSSKGDQMLSIKFKRCSDPSDHLFDNVMLEGAGWGIGKQKLAPLLGGEFKGDLDPLSIVGRRMWVATAVKEYQGKSNLAVNIAELKHAGLQAEEDVPPGCVAPPKAGDEDVPF